MPPLKFWVSGVRSVSTELDMRLEGLAGDRLRLLRQRVVDADDGKNVDRREKIGHEIDGPGGRRRKNATPSRKRCSEPPRV